MSLTVHGLGPSPASGPPEHQSGRGHRRRGRSAPPPTAPGRSEPGRLIERSSRQDERGFRFRQKPLVTVPGLNQTRLHLRQSKLTTTSGLTDRSARAGRSPLRPCPLPSCDPTRDPLLLTNSGGQGTVPLP
jgi:hypothetical protein